MGPEFESPAGHHKTTENHRVFGGFILFLELLGHIILLVVDRVDNLLTTVFVNAPAQPCNL